jgi:hypothetical protein
MYNPRMSHRNVSSGTQNLYRDSHCKQLVAPCRTPTSVSLLPVVHFVLMALITTLCAPLLVCVSVKYHLEATYPFTL